MKTNYYPLILLIFFISCITYSCKKEVENPYISPFIISGAMTTSETWTNIYQEDDWIDYIVQGSFAIENGAILTIEEDVKIAFKADSDIYIEEGSLRAIGSTDHPILFTALDTVDKHWNGIFINQGSDAEFKYCQIAYAGANYFDIEDSIGTLAAANIACFDGQLDISLSSITHSEGCGIALIGEYSEFTQAGNSFSNLSNEEICE